MSKSYTGSRRYTGPLAKRARSLNFLSILEDKIGKPKKTKTSISSQKNKKKRRSSKSTFAEENQQIQKICYLYGLSKKQLKNSFKKIKNKEGTKDHNLCMSLELRIDNIIFKSGFGTRRFARQIVSHKHVKVNGKTVNIPSFKIREGDEIELTKDIYENKILKMFLESKKEIPKYLENNGKKIVLKRLPVEEEISQKDINVSLIIRRYSREV